VAAVVAALAVFAVLLGLDLANRGLAWRLFYATTGEERPLAQVRGMVEWAGNLLRPQPDLALNVPVQHADVSPFGVNTFLEQEVEPAKREQQMQMLADAGFDWIRQQFVWEDIEIHGRGDFIDRRNDPAGIDAWAKYDMIVALADQYDVEVQARIGNPPAWSQTVPGDFAPPADLNDFAIFAGTLAARYRDSIRYFQVWNEPNIYPEWGEQPVNPEQFTDLLCAAYDAIKAANPDAVVIAPALSPTLALTGRDLNELIFLERMYEHGAARCFDVAAAQGYGFFSGPSDQRLSVFHQNFARQQYLRDLMVANGDAHKALWISEVAWNPIDSPEVPADVTAREGFGVVTREQAAAYLPQAYARVMRDFPYVGVMNVWFLKLPSPDRAGQSWYYFRMLEPDFTPLPVFDAMRAYIAGLTPVLYRGVHQGSDWAIETDNPIRRTGQSGAQFDDAVLTEAASFTAHGTHVTLRLRAEGVVTFTRDGALIEPEAVRDDGDGWQEIQVFSTGWLASTHTFGIASEAPFLLDAVMVSDHTWLHVQPALFSAIAVGLVLAVGILRALWARFVR
jgi:polysaccharide biosynthesis protein PslG